MSSERKVNNAGLVIVTAVATGDLCHTLPAATTMRSAIIRKIMWSNNTGVAGALIFGTRTNAGVFAARLPTITCIAGFDGELTEEEIPKNEFIRDTTAGAAGVNGNIYVVGTAGILVSLEIEEIAPG